MTTVTERGRATFRALSAPGVEWADLTDDQRAYWENRALEFFGPPPVEMTLWQCTIGWHNGHASVVYLDAGVQGLPTAEQAMTYITDRMPGVAHVIISAVHYWVQP